LIKILPVIVLAVSVFVVAACSKGGGSASLFKGDVNVGLTDNVPEGGSYVLQDIYNPAVKQIVGVVTVQNAKIGMQIRAEWYQMGLIQFKTTAAGQPEGRLIN
jgi:hypothetical protein